MSYTTVTNSDTIQIAGTNVITSTETGPRLQNVLIDGLVTSFTVVGIVTSSQGFSGTVLTESQPKITGVGTLSNLSVSGITTSSGGIVGTLLTGTQSNVTGLGTLSSLKVASTGTTVNDLQFGSFTTSTIVGGGNSALVGTITLSGFSSVPKIFFTAIPPSGYNYWDCIIFSVGNNATSSSVPVQGRNSSGSSTSGTCTVLWFAVL